MTSDGDVIEALADRIYEAAIYPDNWFATLHELSLVSASAGGVILQRRSDNWIGWRCCGRVHKAEVQCPCVATGAKYTPELNYNAIESDKAPKTFKSYGVYGDVSPLPMKRTSFRRGPQFVLRHVLPNVSLEIASVAPQHG
jgi:hypothetical protein